MRLKRTFESFFAAALFIAALLSVLAVPRAEQRQSETVAIDSDDIGGVVAGPNGPEGGVWVIAETRDLPVRYIKTAWSIARRPSPSLDGR